MEFVDSLPKVAKFSFTQPPIENMAYLLQKKPELHYRWNEIMFEAHHRAFTVARITKADLLLDVQTSLLKAMKEGKSFQHWKKDLKPTLQKKGWWGKRDSVNPKTGEVQEIKIGSTRLKTIYQTNMAVAYAQSRAGTQYGGRAEYLRYVAVMDGDTRATHKTMHGTILHRNNDFWARNYPPNGFNCRCRVDAYTKKEIEAKGWEIEDYTPKDIADKGWAYDKRQLEPDDSSLEEIIEQKVDRINQTQDPDKLIKSFLGENLQELKSERKKWNNFKEFFAAPKGNFAIAKLEPKLKEVLEAKTDKILLSAETIKSHAHHPEIQAFNYYLIKHMQKNILFGVQSGNNKVFLLKKLGVIYEAVIKTSANKKEVYITSMHIISNLEKTKKRLLRKGEEIKL
jgi:SPP1 gp7 family putative phage head morphogenesis protein